MFKWKVVDFSQSIIVSPDERLSWPKTIGLGLQHIVAMFGATFLVPLLTGFNPATTLFFSAISTFLFLIITRSKVPSYLGSSFAFIAPIVAATSGGDFGRASFGIMATGVLLAIVGLIVAKAGSKWIDIALPPVVTGAIVALIGFNLAPAAWNNFSQFPVTAVITLAATIIINQVFQKGRFEILGRLSILLGVVIGYIYAAIMGEVDFSGVADAAWIGLPAFSLPTVDFSVLPAFLPVVLVLIVENVGHIKSVAQMTGANLDNKIGLALFGDGLGTSIAGAFGGSGTTTYAENIGVMAATRIYSTAAYYVAACGALVLALCPKFGVIVATVPAGVLGGVCTMLYGMIGMLGIRIWVENKVDFAQFKNVAVAGVALVIGIADFTFDLNGVQIGGIAIGSIVCLALYHLLNIGSNKSSPAVN